MQSADLTHLKVIALCDIEEAARSGAAALVIRPRAILTPSAREAIARFEVREAPEAGQAVSPAQPEVLPAAPAPVPSLFESPEAEAIKAEIIAVGRKLWHRQYVDGNGGNISFRIGPNEVICTPTLVSKADLRPEDLCLVDLEGNQLAGPRPRTSEILLHLEIYKAVPQAKAVLHCHPPHATAYAITGHVPPSSIIPEYDVFIGSVAVSPYETPGTKKFAETVLPFVKQYNTVLLANHGIVCWADTVTHAEWFAEIVETYCWTLMLAAQLRVPVTRIPPEKEADLLAIKKKLGLPDARFELQECQLRDIPEPVNAITLPPPRPAAPQLSEAEAEYVIQAVTNMVMAALEKRAK
jgi:L-fuculose-phosphate aldolase